MYFTIYGSLVYGPAQSKNLILFSHKSSLQKFQNLIDLCQIIKVDIILLYYHLNHLKLTFYIIFTHVLVIIISIFILFLHRLSSHLILFFCSSLFFSPFLSFFCLLILYHLISFENSFTLLFHFNYMLCPFLQYKKIYCYTV